MALPIEYDTKAPFKARKKVRCLLEDRQGALWIGTNLGVVKRIADGSDFTYGLYQKQYQDENATVLIDQLLEDHNGGVWVRTNPNGKGLFKLSADALPLHFDAVPIRRSTILSDIPKISYIFEDSHHVLWVGTWKEGLYKLNLSA
ncbi:MAG: hypothetical protein HC842_07330, partial [Cytophagales bacterium]|nr:hypothetical protein [Cytophagales bacterium]